MFFVGSGALLSRAVNHARRSGIVVDFVCCPPRDPSCFAVRNHGIRLIETQAPNRDLPSVLSTSSDRIGFSINNNHILDDNTLSADVSFFNIHAGLIQRYRGNPEVCIFAALCHNERHYGVTLHRIMPRQRVDSGPVVSQLEFGIRDEDGFYTVMKNSLESCQRVFEIHVGQILSGNYPTLAIDVSKEAYTYKNLASLCRETDPIRLSRARDFGVYAAFFPKMKEIVDSLAGR